VATGETVSYKYKWTGKDLADFIAVSIYTGLRISDVATSISIVSTKLASVTSERPKLAARSAHGFLNGFRLAFALGLLFMDS
jgi:hypothetical protein